MNHSLINYLVIVILLIAGAAKVLSYLGQELGIGVEGNSANAGLSSVIGLLGMHVVSYMLIVAVVAVVKGVQFASVRILKEYPTGQLVVKIFVILVLAILFGMVLADAIINLMVWGGI
jgi:hypothetical protein